MRYVTEEDLSVLAAIAKKAIEGKETGFYGWKNAPVLKDGAIVEDSTNAPMTVEQALARYKAKLDGAYGERAVLTVAYACALVRGGKRVAFLQRKNDATLPFDAEGWVEVSIEGYPLFHLAPWDLPMGEVAAAGLINVVVKGTADDEEHRWKQLSENPANQKVAELALLLDWVTETPAR